MTDARGQGWRKTLPGKPCKWPGCNGTASGDLWACRDHWLLIPYGIRDRLMAARKRSYFPVVEAEALVWIKTYQQQGVESEQS